MTPLEGRLEAILRQSPAMMTALDALRALRLPDAWFASGAVYQRALNHLTDREPDYGIKDYDLFYFDASDVSWAAEDLVIRRAQERFPPELRPLVETRNQARVHLWFEAKFGEPYAPLKESREALERFVSPIFAVAARLADDGSIEIAAPFGLDDLFALRVRPNPRRPTIGYERVAAGLLERWPELKVEPR